MTASRAKPVSVTITASALPSRSGTSWMWRSRLSDSAGESTMAVYLVTSDRARAVCFMTDSRSSILRSVWKRILRISSWESCALRIMVST